MSPIRRLPRDSGFEFDGPNVSLFKTTSIRCTIFISLPWSGADLKLKNKLTKDKQFAQQLGYKWMEWIVFTFI